MARLVLLDLTPTKTVPTSLPSSVSGPATPVTDMQISAPDSENSPSAISRALLSAGYDGFYSLENQNAIDNVSTESASEEIRTSMKNAEFLYNRAKASLGI